MATSPMGVPIMGNTVPRAGLELTSMAFQTSVLPLNNVCSLNVPTIPRSTCLCGTLSQRSVQTTTLILTDATSSVPLATTS